MIISGLEELKEVDLENINIDLLQDIILLLSKLEPVNKLGNKLHISNLKQEGFLTFDLDNTKELMEISVNVMPKKMTIDVNFGANNSIQYWFDLNRKKITNKECFLHDDNMILKYHYNEYKYYFELYQYEPIRDLKLEFSTTKFDPDSFIKKLFVNDVNVDEIISIVPKESLKVTITTEFDEKEMIYHNNKLVSENKGVYDGEEGKER